MDLHLNGRRVLVTGGSRGIGLAIARQLALEGAVVAIAARDPVQLAKAKADLEAETGQSFATFVLDTGQDASVRDTVAGVVAQFGGLDILVNSAAKVGGGPAPKLAQIDDEAFWSDVNVKVMGYIRCAREAAPHMIAAGWGRIINISGLAARQTGSAIGSMRNVAVSALTKNLADELGPKGINVTAVHPGLTLTDKTSALMQAQADSLGVPLETLMAKLTASVSIGRGIETSEVADLVTFLASPRSVSINGDTIACGGGAVGSIHY